MEDPRIAVLSGGERKLLPFAHRTVVGRTLRIEARRTRRRAFVASIAGALIAGTLGAGLPVGLGLGAPQRSPITPITPVHHRAAILKGPVATSVAGTASAGAKSAFRVPVNTIVATPVGTVQGYASPGGTPTVQVPRTLFGATLSLPVIGYQAGYSEVRLPTRPDGSTAWVKNSSLTFGETPWAIVVHLATTHLTLYRSGKVVATMPVGVGTAVDPTPSGDYFLVLDERPLGPGYGPFIMVTSAHSHAIRNWAGSGDAWVAIHGPLGAGPEIGTTGARVSHGCIRLHTADVSRFRDVLPGSPISIER